MMISSGLLGGRALVLGWIVEWGVGKCPRGTAEHKVRGGCDSGLMRGLLETSPGRAYRLTPLTL
jgi:hypothetical protein